MYLNFLDPKLDFHTPIVSIQPKTCIHTQIPYFSIPNHSSIPVIFFFLLFFFSFLFFFFFFRFLLSLYFQDQNKILISVLSLFDLIPFLFHFARRKLPPSFLQATCLFLIFVPYFILISLFYYSLVLQFSITLDLTYAYSYFGI